jgi:hypothetical protein
MCQSRAADKDENLEETKKMYIGYKEALELERSEVDSLNKALAEEQREHALTNKASIALNDKYCILVEKHNKLEEQYNLLCESTPLSSNTNDTSIPSTSQGCEKCYNLDLNVYSTNLANMEVMKKEIARLNAMLGKRSMEGKKSVGGKVKQPKRPQYKDGRNPHIKDGLGHTHGGKTNRRKVINKYESVQFMSKGREGIDRSTQMVAQGQPRAASQPMGGSAAVKGGSVAPHRKGKTTSSSSAHVKPKKKVSHPEQVVQKPKKSIWITLNRYAYQPNAKIPQQCLNSNFVL